jgi:hypothetical protein
LGPLDECALRPLHLDTLWALDPGALLALGTGLLRWSLLGPLGLALLRLLGAFGAFRVTIAATLGVSRGGNGKRRNGGDQKCSGHRLNSACLDLGPFWRKPPDYNMNGGQAPRRAARFTPPQSRLNPPSAGVHIPAASRPLMTVGARELSCA